MHADFMSVLSIQEVVVSNKWRQEDFGALSNLASRCHQTSRENEVLHFDVAHFFKL